MSCNPSIINAQIQGVEMKGLFSQMIAAKANVPINKLASPAATDLIQFLVLGDNKRTPTKAKQQGPSMNWHDGSRHGT